MSQGDANIPGEGNGRESSRIMLDLGGEGATRAKSQLGSQIAFAAMIVVLAGGAITGMRHLGTSGGLAGESIKIKYQPGKGEGMDSDKFSVVMTELETSGRPVQYAGEPLDEAPFTMKAPGDDLDGPVSGQDDATRRALMQAEREKKEREALKAARRAIEDEFESFRLMSVIGGRRPVARIGNSIVRPGAKLGEHFSVTEILARSVKLVASDGSEWELELPSKSGG